MQKKLNLKRSDKFDTYVAARELASMIVKYLDGTPHARWLGCEQGGIADWDDFVIEEHDGSLMHVQVKRQETDFDGQQAVKTPILQGKNKGEERKLEPIDKAIAGLAKASLPTSTVGFDQRQFRLEIPHGKLEIKDGITVSAFYDLCTACRNPTTTVAHLQQSGTTNDKFKQLFGWLTTWCDFTDWEHIHRVLQKLHIQYTALEADINTRIDETLSGWFIEPDKARQAIIHCIGDNATDTGAVTPRLLLTHLTQFLRPNKAKWIQYKPESALTWNVAGILGGHGINVEFPADVVPALWCRDQSQSQSLRIAVDWPTGKLDALYTALIRLALHLPRPAQVLVPDVKAWRVGIHSKAQTLGKTSDDLGDLPLATAETSLNPSDIRSIKGCVAAEAEAGALMLAMDGVTWGLVSNSLEVKIAAMPSAGDLREAVEALWANWTASIATDQQIRQKIFIDMLSPKSEGKIISPELRVGPLTVEVLAEGLHMLLIVAVAIGGTSAKFDTFDKGYSVRTLALKCWGGTGGDRVQDLIDDDVPMLLGKESASIMILSSVEATPSEIYADSLADDQQSHNSLAAPRRNKLLITKCHSFKKLVKKNAIKVIQGHLLAELEKWQISRDNQIGSNV